MSMQIDPNNKEFLDALQYVQDSDDFIFLTGKAGTGKTTFLKYLKEVTEKEMVVLAPTGVAAINAGGQTIHSFFQIPPSIYTPDDPRLSTKINDENDEDSGKSIYETFRYRHEKLKLINEMELLIIDEVSMVRADLLDVIDRILRVYRDCPLPFGGVQVLLIGDVFQLPPVVTSNEQKILYRFYDSEFFFSARVMGEIPLRYIELKKIYRQSDNTFIDLLNRVRENKMLSSDFQYFRSIYKPCLSPVNNRNYITLATTNAIVDSINREHLYAIQREEQHYQARITGEFSEKDYPTEENLTLKVGAQVMLLKNDNERRYFNGKIGTITRLEEDEIYVSIEYDDDLPEDVMIKRGDWNNVRYKYNEEKRCIEEEIIGTFSQFPVRLAWAITVHKSQGLTFEKVIADIGDSFSAGQVYVALSRCTSLDGLILTSMITPASIKTDPRVMRFTEFFTSNDYFF